MTAEFELTEGDFEQVHEDLYVVYKEPDNTREITDRTSSGLYLVEETHIDSRRWVERYRRTFTDGTGNYWQYYFDRPSTEMQEGSESEVSLADVKRVTPQEKVVIVYG